jgi:hypothetical protein
MTDDEIRALVRNAISRHLGGAVTAPAPAGPPAPTRTLPMAFGRYGLPREADDTACIIEPAVRCDHCGYCQSHGH